MKNTVIKRNKKEKNNSQIISLIKHQLIVLSVYFIVCMIVCALLFFGNIATSFTRYFVILSLSLSSFAGGYLSGRKFKKNGIIVGITNNTPALLIFIFISLILNKFSIDYFLFISVLLSIVFSAIGGIVAVNTRARVK